VKRLAGLIMTMFVLAGLQVAARAQGADTRSLEKKATTAFGLGRYAEAAENYEKAFEIRSEPALLYNAAQAYRLAGNKERALTLYQNYLRLYGNQEKRAEIEAHVEKLKAAIEQDKTVATSPPTGTQPTSGGDPDAGATPSVGTDVVTAGGAAIVDGQATLSTGAALTATAAPPADNPPLTRKPWFWVAAGGGALLVFTFVLVVALGGSAKDPSPSIGSVDGF
jgi:tetratricopeptide (TPR) repeat protein